LLLTGAAGYDGTVAASRAPTTSIRPERPEDAPAVRRVNQLAFGGDVEARLVERLHAADAVILSLVAESDGELVGHLLCSPVEIDTPTGETLAAVGLGPMGVLPERQGRGIGSRLVREGLARLEREGHGAVVLVGHPGYYPRFGFQRASRFQLRCAFEIPDEAFMALELRREALAGSGGVVHYRPEFAEADG
jgi:putative acetyltransferase